MVGMIGCKEVPMMLGTTECRFARLAVALLAQLALGGCSNAGPASVEDVNAYCDASCGWEARCKSPALDCVTKCREKNDRFAPIYRADFWHGTTDCLKTAPCDAKSDACSSAAVLAIGEPSQDRDFAACMAARSTCKSFSDDYCYQLPALTDDARARFIGCFQAACAQQSSCAKTALGD